MSHEDMFTNKFDAADAAIRRRKGLPASSGKTKLNGTVAGKANDVSIRIERDKVKIGTVDVPTTEYMNDFQQHLEDKFSHMLKNLPALQMNKTLTIKTQLGEVIGKVKGLRHRQVEELMQCISIRGYGGHRKNIMIKGQMGGGKSTAVQQCAEALGLTYRYTGQTEMKGDVLGVVHPISQKYTPSEFVKTYTEGGVWVGEELDGWAPRACLALNVPLANGILTTPDGVTHERHPDCVIIACTNTWGTGATTEYVGRNKLDAAFLDRFSPRMEWLYDSDLERTAANDDEVVDAVQLARLNAESSGIKVVISPRSSINIADMIRSGFDMRTAMHMDFLTGLDKAQTRTILEGIF